MKNELMIFKNKEFGQVRFIEVEGKQYAVANDVAKALGYADCPKAVRTHCKGVAEMSIPTNGGKQTVKIIPEGDIYRLIIRSKLPSAEKFEAWVCDEVLPSIRQNGAYISDNINDKQITALQMYSTKEFIKQTFESVGIENMENQYVDCMNYNSNKSTSYKLEIMTLILNIAKQRKEIALSESKMPLVAMIQEIIINISEDIKQKSLRSRSGRIGAKTRKLNVLNNELNELREANDSLIARIDNANRVLDIILPRPTEYTPIPLHGFSVNKQYTISDGKLRRTDAYNIYKRKLKSYLKTCPWQLEKDKHYNIHLLFDHIKSFDCSNFHKSFFDCLSEYFGITDNNFHLMICDTNTHVDSFEQGKTYVCIKERQ